MQEGQTGLLRRCSAPHPTLTLRITLQLLQNTLASGLLSLKASAAGDSYSMAHLAAAEGGEAVRRESCSNNRSFWTC
jgi:hypothetical protein